MKFCTSAYINEVLCLSQRESMQGAGFTTHLVEISPLTELELEDEWTVGHLVDIFTVS